MNSKQNWRKLEANWEDKQRAKSVQQRVLGGKSRERWVRKVDVYAQVGQQQKQDERASKSSAAIKEIASTSTSSDVHLWLTPVAVNALCSLAQSMQSLANLEEKAYVTCKTNYSLTQSKIVVLYVKKVILIIKN